MKITLIYLICLLYVRITESARRFPDTLEKILNDMAFDKFIGTEFDYKAYLMRADATAEKMVPFQDTSNDTYYRIGMIDRRNLDNFTSSEFAKEIGELKKKPWIPIKRIKEELGNCMHMKYGSVSENDFMYDKGVYGWMNMMKFSCSLVGDHFYAFGMAFARTRFRLKQIYLRRQNSYWATSSRSLISRDVQKIIEVFSQKFAESTKRSFDSELQRLSLQDAKRNKKMFGESYIHLSEPVKELILQVYPEHFNHTPISKSKSHHFNTMGLSVKSRVMIVKPSEVSTVVENFSNELTDEACEILDDCKKEFCRSNDTLEYEHNGKADLHSFKKERALVAKLTPIETLIVFTTSKPSFKFEIMKKKTSKGLTDITQRFNSDAEGIYRELLDQQFSHEFHMHHGSMLRLAEN